MRIGILGSGLMGAKLGTLFARAGHEVTFSYARSTDKLARLAREAGAGARFGSPAEAVASADAVLLAVHWNRVRDVLRQAGELAGRVILTCSLPMSDDDTGLVVAHTSSGAEELARMAPGAAVVSAFGSIPSEVLFGVFAARGRGTPPSLLYCGDDERAKAGGRAADTRGRVRAGGCRCAHGRPLHRAVHDAGGGARVRGNGRSRTGLSLRALQDMKESGPGH